MEEDIQTLIDGIITDDYIRRETGREDLTSIVHVTLKIDTSRQSVYDLHQFLPNLQHLDLDNSVITSVRDLGIGLRFIVSLSLSSCGLIDIDGIGVLTGLQELNLSDNSITDVTPLAMHENLQNLNLSGNQIADLSAADSLSSCLALRSLFLSRNPLCKARNYRLVVASIITTLQMLDGRPVDPEAAKKVNNGMILEAAAELRAAEEDMDDEMRLENDILAGAMPVHTQPSPAAVAPSPLPDADSEFTHGSAVVLAGNVAASVRRRRQAEATGRSADRACDDHESTLDVLDAALGRGDASNHGSRGSSQGSSIYREGDVTAALRGSSALHASSNLQPLEDLEAEDEGEGGAASLQLSTRARSRNPSGEYPFRDAAPSPALRGSSQRLSGRRGDARGGGDVSMSFDFDPTVAGSQHLRPRTAASALNSVGKPHSSTVMSHSPVAASPRQRNSSRPQSAASVGSGAGSPQFGRGGSTNAAPFKVSMEKRAFCAADNEGSPQAKLDFPQIKGGMASSKSIVHLDIVKRPTGGYMIAEEGDEECASGPTGLPSTGDDDSDTEDIAVTHAARHRLMHASSSAGTSNSVTSNLKARQQILQRLKATSTKATGDGDEGIPTANSSRCSSPSSGSARRSAMDDPDSPPPRRGGPGGARVEMGIAELGTARKRGGPGAASAECELVSLENSPPRPSAGASTAPAAKAKPVIPKVTQSSKAGMSLGFNLAGSLAAIDKWVQDMNSEDDETEDEGRDGNREGEDGGSASGAGGAGGGIVASKPVTAHWSELDGPRPSSAQEGHSSDHSHASGAKSSRSKILTRDTILSMCSSSGRGSSARSLTQDDEDSELDEPDLHLPSQRRRDARHARYAAADHVERVVEESVRHPGQEPAPTANGRARNADVRNRVTGRSGSRVRGSTVAASEPAPANPASVAERARPRAPVVPDFTTSGTNPPAGARDAAEANADADTVSPPRHTAPVRVGKGVDKPDAELILLLREKPKNTADLRTPGSFQQYFNGMARARMQRLLELAYTETADEAERREKVDKRMKLMEGFMV